MRGTRDYVLAVVLAGGEGQRLMPLTRHRAKPAIPFAGKYRLIDFVLTNLVHSNLLKINVLTQYQSRSLISHVTRGWTFSAHLGQYCEVIPAHSGEGYGWYLGSADALYKNLERIEADPPKLVAVFGADHVYRMDIRQMIEEHTNAKAEISVSVVPYTREEAHNFGCLAVDPSMRVTGFLEKPVDPPRFPQNPDMSLVSMGNYIFNFEILREILVADHNNADSRHDIGGDIFPRWYDKVHIHAYNFLNNHVPETSQGEIGYWRDVGNITSYWRTSMDMVSVSPVFNLYNANWPILTSRSDDPPAKFVFADRDTKRIGIATDSLVSSGCIISGGQIDRCVLSPRVRINSFSSVSESVLFQGVDVGRRCEIRRAIVDKQVQIPPDTVIGFDEEEDRARGITVTEDGIRVVPQDVRFDL